MHGRLAIVTGAAAGIGKAIALRFAEAGATVLAADRDEAGLAEVCARSELLVPTTCDVTDLAALRQLAALASGHELPLAALVNNAGCDRRSNIADLSNEEFRAMQALNIDHQLELARLCAAPLAAAGGGAIVNLSSTAWLKAAPDMIAYHAAKAGILGLTRGLARDLGKAGTRVNAISPGRVFTERVNSEVGEDWIAETKALQCLPRKIMPADIAEVALFLCSDGARAITGQNIVVDAGVV